MPSSARHFFHKNRSQASLTVHDPPERRPPQASPTDSPLHSPAFEPRSASSAASQTVTVPSPRDDYDDDRFNPTARPAPLDESSVPPLAIPTRSQSQRSPPSHHAQPPTLQHHHYDHYDHYDHHHHHHHHHDLSSSHADLSSSHADLNPDSDYYPSSSTAVPKDDRKRRFFRLGLSAKEPAHSNSGGVNVPIIGRSISVRRKPTAPQISTQGGGRPVQQRWSASLATPPSAEEVDRAGPVALDPSHRHPGANLPGPPIPEKDPLTSPRPPTQQGFPVRAASFSHPSIATGVRPSPDRQGSSHSPWDHPVESAQEYRVHSETQYPRPPSHLPSPASAASTSSHPLPLRGPSEALQPRPPEPSSRPSSQHSVAPPSPLQPYHVRDPPPDRVSPGPAHGPGSMGPSTQQQPHRPGSSDLPQPSQPGTLTRENSYQPYPPGAPGPNSASAPAPQFGGQLGINPPGTNYRGGPQSSPMAPQPSTDAGRSTSPSSRSYDDMMNMDVAQVVAKYYELQDKYRKVKRYYFDKDAQVQQLQNTLAHQRLAQSRTSLDDNEYGARFSRLDGAINNLSFNIRRDWRAVPPWLAQSVNRDAPSSPTKEMTAVGRACISRWLVDELLDRYFHPSLDPALSAHLKIIEKNLRRFAAPTPSDEEKDALMARISNWRLATVDGLQEILSSPQAAEYRTALTDVLVEKMTASLSMSLKDPPPPGLEGGVRMIVELAVGLAANIPLESRDVFVEYIAPGTPVNETYMKVESGLPPLTNPGEGLSDGSAGSGEKGVDDGTGADAKDDRGGDDTASVVSVASVGTSGGSSGATTREQKKKSMFGGLMGGTKKAVGSGASAGNAAAVAAAQQQQQQQAQQQQQPSQPQPPKEERVRFAAFMTVEVRGRSVLVRAPVYV